MVASLLNMGRSRWPRALSRIGMGTYRMNIDEPSHWAALRTALLSGVNVIDTSDHFEGGRSERLVGAVVNDLIRADKIQRENLLVITKFGYTTVDHMRSIQGGDISDGTAKLSSTVAHSVSPSFLKHGIDASLGRLQLEHLDVVMLNNPERLMASADRRISVSEVYRMIAEAFKYLETEVARGRIRSYGICSTSMSIPTAPDHLSLEQIVNAADANNTGSSFTCIEYPFNLFETTAMSRTGHPKGLSQVAEEYGLYQFLHRPFMSVAGGQVRMLTTSPELAQLDESALTRELSGRFEAVTNMEMDLGNILGSASDDIKLLGKFIWAQVLADNLARLTSNPFAANYYVSKTVLPAVLADTSALIDYAKNGREQDRDIAIGWANLYREETAKMCETLLKISKLYANKNNLELASVLSASMPSSVQPPSLTEQAIRVPLSAVPRDSTVLVGMRKETYVQEVLAASNQPPLQSDQLDGVLRCPLLYN